MGIAGATWGLAGRVRMGFTMKARGATGRSGAGRAAATRRGVQEK